MANTSRLAIKNVVEFADMYHKVKDNATPNRDWKIILGLFDVVLSKGEMYVPETFYPKIHKWFGKLDDPSMEEAVLRVEEQDIGMAFIIIIYPPSPGYILCYLTTLLR